MESTSIQLAPYGRNHTAVSSFPQPDDRSILPLQNSYNIKSEEYFWASKERIYLPKIRYTQVHAFMI